MSTLVYNELVKQVDALPAEEQLQLAAHLLERARQKVIANKPKRKWRDLRGLATYPMLGEDVQDWILRTRRESDEQRQAQWSDKS